MSGTEVLYAKAMSMLRTRLIFHFRKIDGSYVLLVRTAVVSSGP